MKEEISLIRQIKNEDRKVLQPLIIANHRYVVCVAKRFQNNGLTLHQLIVKGNLGLIKAARHFNEANGFKFISYAIWCIRQSIIQALAEASKNKPIPLNKIGLLSNNTNLFIMLEPYFQREPSIEEIAGMLEFETKIMKDAMQPTCHHLTNYYHKQICQL